MKIIFPSSLAKTLDALNEVFFMKKTLTKNDRLEIAKVISNRQGLPGSYANMFAPTKVDYAKPIQLFTGEKVTTKAATGHILGQEACRALIKLETNNKMIQKAQTEAKTGISARILNSEKESGIVGMY